MQNENAKIHHICKEMFQDKYAKDKYCNVRDNCDYAGEYRGNGHSTCNLKYSIPKVYF